MDIFLTDSIEIYIDLKTTWFQSEIRRIISPVEKQYIELRFSFIDRYIERGLLTIYTIEFFMEKVISLSSLIFVHYSRLGIVI
jgi:hypothetical protein